MAESITCQRGLITAGGDKEPGGGGQAAHSGMRGTGSSFGLFFFFLIRPCAAPFSRLMPMEDAPRWLAGCPRPSPPQRPRGWRMLGHAPVASVAGAAVAGSRWLLRGHVPTRGGTTGKAGEPISHPACCASASPCSLLASPPAKRLSALPSPCNRRQTRATLISAISPLLFP